MKKVTVGQLIDELSKFDRNDPVEILIDQYNKDSVACLTPSPSGRNFENLVTKQNGIHVRLKVILPHDNEKFMVTSTRKIK